jgi:hypothetical protein
MMISSGAGRDAAVVEQFGQRVDERLVAAGGAVLQDRRVGAAQNRAGDVS